MQFKKRSLHDFVFRLQSKNEKKKKKNLIERSNLHLIA